MKAWAAEMRMGVLKKRFQEGGERGSGRLTTNRKRNKQELKRRREGLSDSNEGGRGRDEQDENHQVFCSVVEVEVVVEAARKERKERFVSSSCL